MSRRPAALLHAFKHLADLSMREPLVEIMRAQPAAVAGRCRNRRSVGHAL